MHLLEFIYSPSFIHESSPYFTKSFFYASNVVRGLKKREKDAEFYVRVLNTL